MTSEATTLPIHLSFDEEGTHADYGDYKCNCQFCDLREKVKVLTEALETIQAHCHRLHPDRKAHSSDCTTATEAFAALEQGAAQ